MQREIWFVEVPGCGENSGKVCNLVRALYGLKLSRAAYRALLSHFVQENLKFTPTRIEPDVYIRNNYKSDNKPYCEYFLVYIDDGMVSSHVPEPVMKQISEDFYIKIDEYGPP